MELIPGLHRIDGKRSNIYLWDGEEGLILVDAGSPGDENKVFDYLKQIGRRPTDLNAILITHADLDHVGAAAVIQKQSQAIIYSGKMTAELMRMGKSPKHMPRVVQFILDHFMTYNPVNGDVIEMVEDGGMAPPNSDWQVVATPGHTLDHHSFYSKVSGILFTGDALNNRGDHLKPSPKRINADEQAAQESAKRLLLLHPAVIACGHGPLISDYEAGKIMILYRQIAEKSLAN